eukprot:m.27554 g.27554  ORF g.27554 m.27554 type:complete len:177 (-) comp10271_c0_seq1:132-662(-)
MAQPAKKAKTASGPPRLSPEICVGDTERAIEVYKKALGAIVTFGPYKDDKGRCVHCALKLGNGAHVYLMDNFFHEEGKAPKSTAVSSMNLYVGWDEEDLEAAWKQAIDNGFKVVLNLEKQFWGSTYGTAVDEFGIRWSFGGVGQTDQEKPTDEERAKAEAGETKEESAEAKAAKEE